MIGWILHATGRDPTVMNGAVMKNFVDADTPFASALVGRGGDFVSEVDESDGSIALYHPTIAVLNNISLDHKSLDELRHLFRDFAAKAEAVVVNLDDDETRLLAAVLSPDQLVTYGFANDEADLFGSGLTEAPFAITFEVSDRRSGATVPVALQVPGLHNAAERARRDRGGAGDRRVARRRRLGAGRIPGAAAPASSWSEPRTASP